MFTIDGGALHEKKGINTKRVCVFLPQATGLTIKVEPYTTRVPRSQRGGEIVEPLVREQWFVRMQPLAEPALAAVDTGAIQIVPERFEKVYRMWLDNIKDWCISRQLWWGHRIPVWCVVLVVFCWVSCCAVLSYAMLYPALKWI